MSLLSWLEFLTIIVVISVKLYVSDNLVVLDY